MPIRVTKTHNRDGSITKRTTITRKTILGNRRTNTYVERIPAKKKGCYIATAVYGSYDCPEVWTLRRYRDTVLAKTAAGRLFVKVYYFISPTLVKLFGRKKWFTDLMHQCLDPFVHRLNEKGISNKSYEDCQ